MKQFSIILMLAVGFLAISCGSDSAGAMNGPEYTSAYICPMHCAGSGSAKAGTCPVCKMAYVPNKDFKAADDHSGHYHDDHDGHDHSGHDHGDHDGHDHDAHDGHDHSGHNH